MTNTNPKKTNCLNDIVCNIYLNKQEMRYKNTIFLLQKAFFYTKL
jgi:hypothetical protein